jgi:hypothetical protein
LKLISRFDNSIAGGLHNGVECLSDLVSPISLEGKAAVTREAFKYVLQEFAKSRVITVSLLGIRVGVSDMAVL